MARPTKKLAAELIERIDDLADSELDDATRWLWEELEAGVYQYLHVSKRLEREQAYVGILGGAWSLLIGFNQQMQNFGFELLIFGLILTNIVHTYRKWYVPVTKNNTELKRLERRLSLLETRLKEQTELSSCY